jgi:O-antigen ligase
MPAALLLCAALFANFVLVAGHDFQRVLEIATLLCGGAWLLAARLTVAHRLFAGTAGKLLAAFFLLGLLSSVRALDPRMAGFEVSAFLLLYALAIAVAAEIAAGGEPALVRILQVVAAAGALVGVKFLVVYFGSFSLGIALQAEDFTPGFSNIRAFNHVQTSTLPLLVLLCCLAPKVSRLRWLWLCVTAYWWLALYATTARGTLVGMAAASIAVALLLGRAALPYIRQLFISAMLGLAAYLVLLVAVPMLLGLDGFGALSSAIQRTAADPASGRMHLWRIAVVLIMQHPVLGVGPMHFAHYGRPALIGAHPHDWLLQIASEWGLPALACFALAIGLAVRALVRAAHGVAGEDGDNRAVAAALVTGAVAILVDGLVSGILVMPQSQLGVTLYLACAIGWYRTRVPAPQTHATRAIVRLGVPVLVVATMAGLGNLVPDALAHLSGEPMSAQLQAVNTGWEWPRLWKAGYF